MILYELVCPSRDTLQPPEEHTGTCFKPIELEEGSGEYWGGSVPTELAPERDPIRFEYKGAEYWQYFVYAPQTHAVNEVYEILTDDSSAVPVKELDDELHS